MCSCTQQQDVVRPAGTELTVCYPHLVYNYLSNATTENLGMHQAAAGPCLNGFWHADKSYYESS